MPHNPIICALDTKDKAQALELAKAIKPQVGAVKLGLEFFIAHGPEGIRHVQKAGVPIFLDLKLHDIPNTVAEAVRAAMSLDIFMLTIHCSGGAAMLQAAMHAAKEAKHPPHIVGVTVLTSMDGNDLQDIGIEDSPQQQALRLASLAKASGLSGVVCSAHELQEIRKVHGKGFLTVVPGIRPEGAGKDDQKRTMTPREAMQLGADHLVIGRPITQAKDPVEAAKAIKESI